MKTLLLLLAATLTACGAPKSPLPGVKVLRDVPYVPGGHPRQKLDLYLPEQSTGPRPLLVYIHGGGWRAGEKDSCPPAQLVPRGFAAASLAYRLTYTAPFPAQIEDCRAALRFLRAHAAEYGLDPQRIGVWGHSAGGHLVALLGTSGDEKSFDKGAHLEQSAKVQAVCDFFGPTEFRAAMSAREYGAYLGKESALNGLFGGPLAEHLDLAERASPTHYISADDPPFLIIHGDADTVVPIDQSQILYQKLKAAGVPVQFHTVKGGGHGGRGFETPEIMSLITTFFTEALRDPTAPHIPTAQQTTSPALR